MISVIIPLYNVEAYLPACLDSVLSQTYADLEIILINDGSTDSSPAICREYAARDGRIRVIHQENQGMSAARNAGIEIVRGEFITFVDSDDYLLEDAIETMVSLQKRYDADISIVSGYSLDTDNKIVKIAGLAPVQGEELFTGADRMDAYIRQRKIQNAVWARLYRRELFANLRFAVGKTSEDLFISHLLVHAAERIVISEKPGYVYRLRPGSIMRRRITKQDFDVIEAMYAQSRFIRQHYPQLYPLMPVKLCSAAVTLVLRSGADRFSDREMDRLVKRVIRENLKPFLRSGQKRSRKLWAAMSIFSLRLTRACVRLYRRAKRGE